MLPNHGWAIAILLAALVLLNRDGRIFSPARLLFNYWGIVLLAGYAAWPPFEPSGRVAIAFLVSAILFGAGALLGSLGARTPHAKQAPATLQPPPAQLRRVSIAGVAAFGVASAGAAHSQGLSIASLTTLDAWFSAANALSVARYGGGDYVPTWVSAVLSVGFASCLLMGALAPSRRRQYFWVVLPNLGAVVYSALTTERLVMLIAVALTLGSFVARATYRGGETPRLTLRTLGVGLLLATALGAAFFTIALLRVGDVTPALVAEVQAKQGVYAFGSVNALSAWAETVDVSEPMPTNGTGTFGFMRAFSDSDGSDLIQKDVRIVTPEGGITNVYTILRPLMHDFDYWGAALFVWAAGLAFAVAARRTADGSLIASAIMTFLLATVGLANFGPLSSFNNVALGLVGAMFYARNWLKPKDDGSDRSSVA